MDLILAHDLGTSGNKATLFDTEGRIVASEFVPYPTMYPHDGWCEQRPEDWWKAVVESSGKLLAHHSAKRGSIAAVGFSGHMMGSVPVDAEGRALSDAMIHSDTRSAPQALRVEKLLGAERVYGITANPADPHYPAFKIAWIKEQLPELYAKTSKFLQCKDYIAGRLTGNFGVTDFSDASLYALFDITARAWSDEMIQAAGVDRGKLPEAVPSSTIVGKVTREASEVTGIPEGTPVVIGGGDGACATVGASAIEPGEAYNYIGSTSWVSAVTDKPLLDPKMRVFSLCDLDPAKYNVLGTVQCAGAAYEWCADTIGAPETAAAEKSGSSRFALLDDLASQAPAGCGGLIFLPYLQGERTPIWDPKARGVFFGLSLVHTRAHMARAVLEGVAFGLRSVADVIEELGVHISSIRVIGGGAQGGFWRRILASSYARPVLAPEHLREATSYGAAIAAGVGVGIFQSTGAAKALVRIAERSEPDPEMAKLYDETFAIYESLYPALKDGFARLAELRKE